VSTENAGAGRSALAAQASFASLVLLGIALGWLFVPQQWRSFDIVYALVLPVCSAALCTHTLLSRTKHRSWLVPLQLVALMATLAQHPHVRALCAVSIAAGSLAMIASFCGRKYPAVACTLVCGFSISASLLIPLFTQG
jgi:hypothetical protein